MDLVFYIIISIMAVAFGALLLKYVQARQTITSLQQTVADQTDQIRKLNLEIIFAEEKHRQYIATEFHDRIAQLLAVAKNKTGILRSRSKNDNHDLHELYDLIDRSIHETRALVRELHPPISHNSQFGTALVHLVRQICEGTGIQVDVENFIDTSRAEHVDREIKTILFQSIREIINNVVKHAGARMVRVELWMKDEDIWIRIEDDGIGFQLAEARPAEDHGGYGLANVQSRLTQFNGRFDISSNPGRGTVVTLSAPVHLGQNQDH
ncbi:MAG TPA: ATP-binding protein [bacterium]|nr:ATP-binding protein [bacterium]